MNEAFKIGYRNLKQRKARTALTILAIALGISILVGVNIGSDMIQSSFEGTLDENLGYIDVVSNIWGYNGPSYQDVKNAFDRGNLQYLDSWVPRYVNYLSEICLENDTFFDYDERLDSFMIGLDTNSDMEKNFGRVKVISVHENFSQDLVGKYASPDLFLKQSNNITRPVVLTRRFLETNDIMENVSAGDVISIRNRYPHPDFPFSTWYSPATWPNFTVVAIVDDLGKLGTASLNPYSNYFIYLGLEDMWNFVFNEPNLEQPINYIMAHSTERAHVEELGTSIQDLMTDELGLYFSSSTPKQSWIKGMTPAFNIIRVAFSIFAAISLVVCGVLIKNLFETAKQTDIHEIGILKGIGFGQSFILKLYLTQIFIMASIGIALGLLIGLGFASAFVTFLTRSTLTTNILNITFELSIKVNVSVTTLMTGIGLGYAIPFGFGLIPVLQTARIEVINAIKSGRTTGAPSVKREVGKSLATLAGGIGLTIACTVSAITGITQLLDMKSISYQDFIAPTIAIFAGIVGFLMGMILIGIFALPVLSKVFTWAILLPMQRSLKQICYRTLMRNKRRTINTFMMMAIGLSFTVTITTITSSISAGIYPRSKTIIGGDIQLGSFLPSSYGLQTMNRTFISEIENLSLVDNACMYRHSIDPSRFYSWVYTTVGLAATRSVVPRQLDQYQEYLSMAGNKVDNYGYITGGSYNSYKEYLSVSIIDGKKYYDINNDAILKVPQTGGRTVEDVFTRLDTTASIILQSDLQGAIKKTVGQTIVLQIEGMSAELEIVGYADVLPGNPWTFGLEFLSGFSDINNPYAKDLSAVISWNTYNNITGNFFKNIDLIIKNRFWQEGYDYYDYTSDAFWGILGFPINKTFISQLFHDNLPSGSCSCSFNTNNYFPIPVEYFADRPFPYHVNQTQMNDETFQPGWNPMNASIVAVDIDNGVERGKPRLVQVSPVIPEENRGSVEDILAWCETNLGVDACVVNEKYVGKGSSSNYGDPSDIDYVHEFTIGDQVRFKFNGYLEYTLDVVATVESNLNYLYQVENDNYSSPVIFNPKTMNYNSYQSEYYWGPSGMEFGKPFIADMNSIFISSTKSTEMLDSILGLIDYFDDMELIPGLNLSDLSVLDEMMKYEGKSQDFSNLVYVSVSDTHDVDQVETTLEQAFLSHPETENFTVFNPKKGYMALVKLDQGFVYLGCERENIESAVEQIENFYRAKDVTFRDDYIQYYGKETRGWDFYELLEGIMELVTLVFTLILSFSIIISLLGLSISMLHSIQQRQREIGTLRAVGYSKRRILFLIYGENMALTLLGILIGLIAGIFTATTMISQVPFTILLPIIFNPPISSYIINISIIFSISLSASIIPAYKSMKLDIASVLRAPD